MADARFERLLVCLPARSSLEELLAEAARVAALVSARAVEVVTSPVHDLHGSRRGLVGALFGRRAGAIHVVPTPDQAVGFAASIADVSSLIVTSASDAVRLPRRIPAAALVLPSVMRGRTVMAVVDPDRDAPAVVGIALDLAVRLSAPKVVVCHPWFDEAVVACDDWEARAHQAHEERLSIFLARVPESEMPLDARVVFAPAPERTLARLAAAEDVALVVSPVRMRLGVPVLLLPDAVARRPMPPSGLAALWQGFLDGTLPA